ncbi:MAG: hypothetical protein Q8R24_01990 [Legionellaceae bacterium]|nr:hypothetical protein [Legionellaceae bacterium]
MKKVLCTTLLSLLLSSPTLAESLHLVVILRNFGTDNCTLIKKVLIEGTLDKEKSFPYTLPADGYWYQFSVTGNKTDASVTYQCGKYKKFTLTMGQYMKSNDKHSTIDAKMIDAVDVFEKHQTLEANPTENRYTGTLEWDITQ